MTIEDGLGMLTMGVICIFIATELFGSTITSQAFFTEAPAVNALASGNADYYLISFALTEV